jgi:hypothetical protein
MAAFLAWVFSVSNRVYQWFGDQYNALYAGAINAWNWAVSQAQTAYSNASSYAYSLFNNLNASLYAVQGWLQSEIVQLQAAIASISSISFTQVIAWVSQQLTPVYALINGILPQAQALITQLRQDLIGFVQGVVSDARTAVTSLFAWVNTFRGYITTLANSLDLRILPNLVKLAGSMYAQLSQFLQDPVTWILDMLSGTLLSAIFWLLAQALGATQSELPNHPPWKE